MKHCKITTFSPYPISKAENIEAGGRRVEYLFIYIHLWRLGNSCILNCARLHENCTMFAKHAICPTCESQLQTSYSISHHAFFFKKPFLSAKQQARPLLIQTKANYFTAKRASARATERRNQGELLIISVIRVYLQGLLLPDSV